MTKQSGLGAGLLVGGYSISGDINSVQRIASPRATLDVTAIDKSAFERLLSTKDGGIDYTAYFNKASGRAHPVLKSLPYSDAITTYMHRQVLGAPTANLVGKQINYDPNRGADGSLLFNVSCQANGYGLEWGTLATDGLQTFTGAGNGTSFTIPVQSYLVRLNGSSGNYLSTPDAASLDITGDIDLRAKVSLDDWTPSAQNTILGKYNSTTSQRSYQLAITTAGNITIGWSTDGTATLSATSSVATGFADGSMHWIRATLDVDNGAAGKTATFYTSEDGVTWTQLGTAQTTASTTSIFSGSAVLEVGSQNAGTSNRMTGKFYEAVVMNGIGGTEVAHPVAAVSSVTDATGKTWTINGTAFSSYDNRYGIQAYLQVVSFTGTNAQIGLQGSLDDGATDTYATTDASLEATVTTAPYSVRLTSASGTSTEKNQRLYITGTFSSITFALSVVVNEAEVSF